MIKGNKMKKKITLTIEEEINKKFRDKCAEVGMKVSPRIEVLMKKDLKEVSKK